MKWVCWGGVLCDFSPLVMELQNPLVSSNGKDSRTQQLDGSKEATGEVTVSEGKPLGRPHITTSVYFMLGKLLYG